MCRQGGVPSPVVGCPCRHPPVILPPPQHLRNRCRLPTLCHRCCRPPYGGGAERGGRSRVNVVAVIVFTVVLAGRGQTTHLAAFFSSTV